MVAEPVSLDDIAKGNVLFVVRFRTIDLRKDGTARDTAPTAITEYGVYDSYDEAEQKAALLNQKETPWCGSKKEYFIGYRNKT